MNFCTDCGTKIQEGVAYCSNCGAKANSESLPNPVSESTKTSFPSSQAGSSSSEYDWEAFFSPDANTSSIAGMAGKYGSDRKHCIVLTNRGKLREALEDKYLEFEIALRMHSLNRGLDGWRFHLLDLSSNKLGSVDGDNWKDCVKHLHRGVERLHREGRAKVDAVFIVGDESIIPMAVFDNPVPLGPDVDVDSDLPYSTLKTEDPFICSDALEMKIAVGRLPTGKLDRGSVGLNYFRHAAVFISQPIRGLNGFGVSAEVWQDASHEVASQIGGISLQLSPELSLEHLGDRMDLQSNYLYFNVHGSDMDKYWYGESIVEGCVPVASPSNFSQLSVPNALATEACYGARFIGLDSSDSCLRSALGHKTLAFSGSSRIAYGPSGTPIGLADLIAQHFLSSTKSGETFGASFTHARLKVLDKDYLTPHDLLTAVEFNLFADPTLTLPSTSSTKATNSSHSSSKTGAKPTRSLRDPLSSVRSSLSQSSGGLRVRMPDVLGDVRASLDATWAGIRDHLIDNIHKSDPNLSDTKPHTRLLKTGLTRTEILQLSALKKEKSLFIGRVIYADRSGKILEELRPK